MRNFALLIFLLFLGFSCSSAQENLKGQEKKADFSRAGYLKEQIARANMPLWIDKVPQSSDAYFFVGLGENKDRTRAKNKATQDALSQVTLLIHTSINTKSSFSSVYKEKQNQSLHSDNEDFSLDKEGYSKLKVMGQGSINDFAIKEHYSTKKNNIVTWYTLAKVSKSTVEKARAEIEKLRQKLRNMPVIISAQNRIDNEITANYKLKAFFEAFYKAQGYYILAEEIGAGGLSTIKAKAKDSGAKMLIYAVIEVSKVFKDISFYIADGTLVAREIFLFDDKTYKQTLNLYLDTDRGIGLSRDKAVYKLEGKLINKLKKRSFHFEDDVSEGQGSGGGYFAY